MKKIFILTAIVCLAFIFSGCNGGGTINSGSDDQSQGDNVSGGTDADGFVRMPGEPSRGSSAYYIVEDICGQFTEKFITGITGKAIVKTRLANLDPQHTCTYYTLYDEAKGYGPFFSVAVSYLNFENQKKGNEFLDRTIKTDPRIKMEHFIAVQEDGLINGIYLALGPEKFISLSRSSAKVMTEDEMLDFAVKIADKVKNFK